MPTETIPKNGKKYEVLLAAVIGARATSFIFSKIILENMGAIPLWVSESCR